MYLFSRYQNWQGQDETHAFAKARKMGRWTGATTALAVPRMAPFVNCRNWQVQDKKSRFGRNGARRRSGGDTSGTGKRVA